ncbi:MAG: FadR/GntR family transcriptional regulator [Actinophytocola sp.]|uniref:FadR/GntR family transcriptional regulator n=1 Tax=Actinophytocola sp. TaxID=1872138 RepID=UPI003D6BDC2A
MALQPVARRSVPDAVFEQILADVVTGEFAPGDALPSERRLAEVLGVSRPAVREALQRVAAAGLVEVRQGDTTTVRDYRRHASLDLLPRLLSPRGELDLSVARSILEARLLVGPKVAELAAERAGTRLEIPLRDIVDALEAAPDAVGRQRQALAFWDQVVDGADSIAFRLMFNSLRAAYEPAIEVLGPVLDAEVTRVEVYRALTAAITAGDAARARRLAENLLGAGTDGLLTVIRKLEEQE